MRMWKPLLHPLLRGEKLKGGSADRVVWGIISPLERGPIDRSFRAIDQGCVVGALLRNRAMKTGGGLVSASFPIG